MAIETLTYAELGERLAISSMAARSLAKRQRLPRSFSEDGKALVSVDLAGIKHSPRPSGRREAGNAAVTAKIASMRAEGTGRPRTIPSGRFWPLGFAVKR